MDKPRGASLSQAQPSFFRLVVVAINPPTRLTRKLTGERCQECLMGGDVFQLVNDGFDDGSLSQQQTVIQLQQGILHSASQFGDE